MFLSISSGVVVVSSSTTLYSDRPKLVFTSARKGLHSGEEPGPCGFGVRIKQDSSRHLRDALLDKDHKSAYVNPIESRRGGLKCLLTEDHNSLSGELRNWINVRVVKVVTILASETVSHIYHGDSGSAFTKSAAVEAGGGKPHLCLTL